MKMNTEELNQLLKNLTEQSQQLGENMRHSALQLQNNGIIPEQTLIEEIQSFQQQLQKTHQLLAEESGVENPSEKPASLETLRATVQQLQMRQHASEVLNQIPLIIHREESHFLPLQECCTVASLLKENMESSSGTDIHPEVQTVLDGKHPLCALLVLVQTPDDLDDEIWSQHNESLTTAFGRQLATAVARGKLEIRKADDSQDEETSEETTKNRLQPQKTK